MITQCEIRKLYARKDEAGVGAAIDVAKACERRRCGHHPDEYPEPLGTLECIQSVVDPKEKGDNKHRYVVASQSQEVRRMLRAVRGVPLIYIKRSVMILEPMSDESALTRARDEKSKFRAELKATLGKRKREEKADGGGDEGDKAGEAAAGAEEQMKEKKKKKKKKYGPKGPNPLSAKKARKPTGADGPGAPRAGPEAAGAGAERPEGAEARAKRKRRRKNKAEGGEAADADGEAGHDG